MGMILVLGYAALCVIAFKILRMPVNRWTVTTAGVSGVVVVGGLLLGMNYNHPFATDGRLYFYTTPITPTVQGIVIEVAVRPNVPLKKGEVLFRLDPRPYQAVVDQKKALLAEAEQNIKVLKASYDQALAAVEKARAEFGLARQTYDRQLELFEKKVVAQASLDTALRNLEFGAASARWSGSWRGTGAARLCIGNRRHQHVRGAGPGGTDKSGDRSERNEHQGADRWLRHPAVSSTRNGGNPINSDDGLHSQRHQYLQHLVTAARAPGSSAR